ncbi:hypothetical protein D3C87_1308570 [compost metagenome]
MHLQRLATSEITEPGLLAVVFQAVEEVLFLAGCQLLVKRAVQRCREGAGQTVLLKFTGGDPLPGRQPLALFNAPCQQMPMRFRIVHATLEQQPFELGAAASGRCLGPVSINRQVLKSVQEPDGLLVQGQRRRQARVCPVLCSGPSWYVSGIPIDLVPTLAQAVQGLLVGFPQLLEGAGVLVRTSDLEQFGVLALDAALVGPGGQVKDLPAIEISRHAQYPPPVSSRLMRPLRSWRAWRIRRSSWLASAC